MSYSLNLMPTLSHPSAPVLQLASHAISASGGSWTPCRKGTASGYGSAPVDVLGKSAGRRRFNVVATVQGLPETKSHES